MKILELTNRYGKAFLDLFMNNEYALKRGVYVSSKIDSSVFLVGSTISVMKSYLLSNAPIPKLVMMQRAIRTQSLRKMENKEKSDDVYGSYFLAMGALAPYSCLEQMTKIAITYLSSLLGNRKKGIMLRVNSEDNDLLNVCKKYCFGSDEVLIEENSRPLKYYQHHYGLDNLKITGRNFNIAVQNGENAWSDVANVIVIERAGVPFAVEFAMGMSTLISNIFGLPHTMLGNTVADIFVMKNMQDYWIGDCLCVVNCLKNEGVIPNSSKMQGRIYKRYQKLLFDLCSEKKVNADELLEKYGEYDRKVVLPL